MKTHQEIHDAIKHLPLQAGSHYSTDKWAEVLHALNDRIEALEKRLVPDDGSAASDERLRH